MKLQFFFNTNYEKSCLLCLMSRVLIYDSACVAFFFFSFF